MLHPRVIRKRVIVLVDAYRSGSFLSAAFLSYGYNCVHVQTLDQPIGNGSHGGPYIKEVRHRDVASTVAALAGFDVAAVVPGHEVGVELADALNEFLRTPYQNGTALSAARRDKARMRAHAFASGIACPRFDTFSSAINARNFAASIGCPVVVKPTRSAGGQGVRLCDTPDKVYQHVAALLQGASVGGDPNTAVVVEEHMRGDLYMVNTVSVQGVHHVTDLWSTRKRLTEQGAFIFEYSELVGPGKAATAATAFTSGLLTKFGISHGPAHTEVYIQEDGVPALVEIGARIQGNMDPSMTLPALGTNQIVATVQAYLGTFHALRCSSEGVPLLNSHCRSADLISTGSGVLVDDLDLSPIRRLASFWSARIDVQKGSRIDPTSELLNVPGSVVLVHSDPTVIAEDYESLRNWESEEFGAKLR
jgi:biotin carboxylase